MLISLMAGCSVHQLHGLEWHVKQKLISLTKPTNSSHHSHLHQIPPSQEPVIIRSPTAASASGEWQQHPALVDPPPLLVHCHLHDPAHPARRLPCSPSLRQEVPVVECLPRQPHAGSEQVSWAHNNLAMCSGLSGACAPHHLACPQPVLPHGSCRCPICSYLGCAA